MDWAKLIGTFIGATVIAIVAGWQVYGRLVRPLIKRFEPIVSEITGPGNEPGLRRLVSDVGNIASAGLAAANNAATGVNALRTDVQQMAKEQGSLRNDVETLAEARVRQGERIGALEGRTDAVEARLTRVEQIQDQHGCRALTGVTEGSQGPTGTGAGGSEILAPQPSPRNVKRTEHDRKG